MMLEIHKAIAADTADLLQTMNEALRFKLSHGDTTWEKAPFTTDDIVHAIERDTTYAVMVNGAPAGGGATVER
ncbi:MAG TPA: hypothetical protein VMB52_00365 [Verrucomicrobiae bacterium]|nr:hypothetical protein [Verrucomicrobiae bacterium]